MPRRSSVFGKQSIDTSELRKFADAMTAKARAIQSAIRNVQPEFGAYMSYSLYLEVGTKRMAARPHLELAVSATAGAILNELNSAMIKIVAAKTTMSATQTEDVIAKAWIRALMGPTRQYAVAACTAVGAVQYGFHRRSISGYAYRRSTAEIQAFQTQSIEARMAQVRADAARKKKKAPKKKTA